MTRVTIENNGDYPTTFVLGPDRHYRVEGDVGMVVIARRGALWITASGTARDIVLRAGECFTLDRGGSILIGSLGGPAVAETAAAGAYACAA